MGSCPRPIFLFDEGQAVSAEQQQSSSKGRGSPGALLLRGGFTLLEVMLAVSILALIMAVAWGTYATATTQQRRMQDINVRLHGVQQAMVRMVRELSMAFVTPHGQEESQLDIRYRTGFVGKSNRVDFTSLAHMRMFRDDKVGDQSEISYFVAQMRNDEGDMVRSLVRREQAPIDDDFQKGGTVITLLEGVESFSLSYWDDAKADVSVGSDGWIDDWDTEKSDFEWRLPSRVRIEIEIADPMGGRGKMKFSTQAEIHLTEALDF